MPRVSVIIPTYNSAKYVGQAIESVLAQTCDDYEIIVVDDGSTDDTVEVLRPHRDKIRYFFQENRGLSAARNAGIRMARGEYLAFLDADDLLLPHKLASQAAYLNNHPEVGLVGGGWIYIDENGAALREQEPWLQTPRLDVHVLLRICPFVPHCLLVRRQLVIDVGLFDERLRRVEDVDLWLRLAHAGCVMAWQREIVCQYRLHSTNMTRDMVAQKKVLLTVVDNFFSRLETDDPLHLQRNEVTAEAHLRGFAREYAIGQIDEAKLDLEYALELNPELFANDAQRIREYVVGTAASVFVTNPGDYITMVLDNLPDDLAFLREKRDELLASVRMSRFYTAHAAQDWPAARRAYPAAVVHDPRWLANRGALRMWLDAVIGPARVDRLRRVAGKS